MTALASRLLAEVRGAVARGWCAPANSTKVMDTDLAEAIAQEVCALMQAEAAAALSVRVPEGDMALALEWVREIGMRNAPFHVAAIEEAIAAYDPEHVGAQSGRVAEGREAVAWYITWNDGTTEVSPDPCCPDDGSCVALYLATTPQPGDGVDAARLDWLRDNEFDLVTRREDIDEDEYRILWFVIDPRKTTRRHLHSISGHPLGSPREAIDAAIARSAAPSAKGV